MGKQPGDNFELGVWIDFRFFFRSLKKMLLIIICASMVTAVAGYVGSSLFLKNTYSAEMIFTVLSRQNNSSALTNYAFNNAVTRNVDMWNSNVLRRTIAETYPDREIKGTLSASAMGSTGLISLVSTANTAEDAFFLLKAAVGSYRKVDGNFDSDFYSMPLTRATSESIRPYYNNPKRMGILVAFLTLFGGCGLIFVWSIFTKIIHTPAQAKELLNVQLFEALPNLKKVKGKIPVNLTDKGITLEYLEAFERLTSYIENSLARKHKKILMMTSISENEGKSTVSSNLAISLARRGNKVLLIDLDLRNPSAKSILSIPEDESKNVVLALENKKSLKDVIIKSDTIDNLSIALQFKPISNADHLLEVSGLKEHLKKLKKEYNYILIDTPPVGPVRDAEVIASFAETTMFVVCQDRTSAYAVNDAVDALDEMGTDCIGAVLYQSSVKYTSSKSKRQKSNYSNYYRRVEE